MEKAFSSPYVLTQRLGRDLDAAVQAGHEGRGQSRSLINTG